MCGADRRHNPCRFTVGETSREDFLNYRFCEQRRITAVSPYRQPAARTRDRRELPTDSLTAMSRQRPTAGATNFDQLDVLANHPILGRAWLRLSSRHIWGTGRRPKAE
jgi:hypothetical protein